MAENRQPHEETELAEEWVLEAYDLKVTQELSWREIARRVEKDRATVQKHVERYQDTIAAIYLRDKPDPLAPYVDGLKSDMRAQLAISEEAVHAVTVGRGDDAYMELVPEYRTRVAALKEVSAIREKIAAALRVVTKREGREHTGANGAPQQLEHIGLERLMEIARNGNGRPPDETTDP